MFRLLRTGVKLLFVHAVPLRLFFEVVGFWAAIRCGDGVKILLDAFCLIKIPRVGCLVFQKNRGVLVAYCRRRFERLETADSCGDDSKDRYRDRYLREKWIAQKSGMLGVLGVLEVLNWRFGHEPTPRAGKVGLYRGTRITAIKADVGRAVGSRGRRQRSQPSRYLTTSRVCDLNSGKVGNTLGGGAVSVSAMAGISRETKSHRTGLAASLFGVTSISDVLARVEHAVKGRLLVFFSGRSRDGR
jgi:hypothetical protein